MSDQHPCPQCGTVLPPGALEGLCPACLLKQGVVPDSAVQGEQSNFEPLAVTEVARLFPQLEILELIGKGGMGAIYKARQTALGRFVALKLLPTQAGAGPAFAERFNREARALARLSHPNIVTVHEFGQVKGLHYFIMEYVDGVNLRQLERAGRLAPREALQVIPQICDALQYAHDEGVVHRDIKPENVLVDRKGKVKIADFGLAKILGHDPEALRLTGEGQVMGTPHYMAPEQVERPLEVDHRADIFALGVVFYEMLTGELPLGKFAPPSRKVQVDVRLDDVVLRALEKEPERRYQQASQVKTAVEGIASTSSTSAASAKAPEADFVQPEPSLGHRLQLRFWPPLVGRRNGQRVVNWPSVAMRAARGLMIAIVLGLGFGIGIGMLWGPRLAIFAAVAEFSLIGILLPIILGIRILRGFAMPITLLPDLGGPSESAPRLERATPAPGPAKIPKITPAMAGVSVLLGVFLLTLLITAVLPESYSSVARMEVLKAAPGSGPVLRESEFDPYFIQTEFEKIQSQQVLEAVIHRPGLNATWARRYGSTEPLPDSDMLALLKKQLEVRHYPNTPLISVRCYSEESREAAELANAIVESFRAQRPRGAVTIVDYAQPTRWPSRPNVPLNLFLGLIAGLVLGVGTAAVLWAIGRLRAYATPPRNKGILEFLIVAACLELLGAWWLLVNPHRAIADIGDMSLRPGKTSQVEVIPGK